VRRELWRLYRLATVNVFRKDVAADGPFQVRLLKDQADVLSTIADEATAARRKDGSVLVLVETTEGLSAVRQTLLESGLRCHLVDQTTPLAPSGKGHESPDAIVIVERDLVMVARASKASGDSRVRKIICLNAPRERRQQRARRKIFGVFLPGVPVEQLLTLEDLLVQRQPQAGVAHFIFRMQRRMPALGNLLICPLFHFALARTSSALRQLRREHYSAGKRLGKLLAFTGARA
jgi:hypothetical protein